MKLLNQSVKLTWKLYHWTTKGKCKRQKENENKDFAGLLIHIFFIWEFNAHVQNRIYRK